MSFDPRDLKIDTFKSGGMQLPHVRITHVPTGIQVSASDEPTQTENRIKAMKLLREQFRARAENPHAAG